MWLRQWWGAEAVLALRLVHMSGVWGYSAECSCESMQAGRLQQMCSVAGGRVLSLGSLQPCACLALGALPLVMVTKHLMQCQCQCVKRSASCAYRTEQSM